MKINISDSHLKVAGIILLLIIAYFPVFLHLENLSIREWDEARRSVNAYEMYQDGNYLVQRFEGQVDMWNTKPLLLNWLQALGMHIFGPGELALRLPSAIAAYLLIIGLLFFTNKYTKTYWFGIFTVLVLITANGYIQKHATRTGDYDSLLTMFTTFYCLAFFSYFEFRRTWILYLAFILLTFAVLTKGVMGLFFAPGLLLYIILRRELIGLLKNKHLYFGMLIFTFLTLGFYLLRESVTPGYLEAVYNNELGGRYLQVVEEHKEGYWFYLQILYDTFFKEWFWFIPLGLIAGFFVRVKQIRRLTLFSFVMIITYFLVISSSQTKLYWYGTPMYPFLAMICAVFIYFIFTLIRDRVKFVPAWANVLILAILVGGLYFRPYKKVVSRIYNEQAGSWEQATFEMQYFLRNAIENKTDLQDYGIIHEGHTVPLMLYVYQLNEKGMNLTFMKKEDLHKGNHVISDQKHVQEYIEGNYNFKILYTGINLKIYEITGGDS
ncbi:MAG: glycosyltransferase family 39 protein [Bacteroidales bacterium]|nr:glycosyltransferase family 39 protein [Bacteroidales bacterium]